MASQGRDENGSANSWTQDLNWKRPMPVHIWIHFQFDSRHYEAGSGFGPGRIWTRPISSTFSLPRRMRNNAVISMFSRGREIGITVLSFHHCTFWLKCTLLSCDVEVHFHGNPYSQHSLNINYLERVSVPYFHSLTILYYEPTTQLF